MKSDSTEMLVIYPKSRDVTSPEDRNFESLESLLRAGIVQSM